MDEIMDNPFIYPYGREINDEDLQKSETDTCIYVTLKYFAANVLRSIVHSNLVREYELD